MCGISGIWFRSETKREKIYKYSSLMSKALLNRGPDDEGIWTDYESCLGLAHRRLSIRDLTQTGSQPMLSSDRNLVIIFNGEIYNFETIKMELRYNNWNGTSDTEVLLEAIREWGIEKALRKCHGMFSLALWNIEKKKLILARDRFGEKPLYWGQIKFKNKNKRIFTFASDLSSIWAIPELEKEINYSAFSDFLKYGYVKAPNSIQQNIFQLLPGHYIEITSKDKFAPEFLPTPVKWWDIKKNSHKYFSSQNKIEKIEDLEETLNQVINEQKIADVSSATFLSGGIDSSLLAAILQNQSSKRIKTFNISFPDSGHGENLFNEGPYAKKIANYLKTDHTEIPMNTKDIMDIIPKISEIYSEPFSDSSQLATFLLCKEIKNSNIKVAIGGDGADELFGGYNRHYYGPLIKNTFKNIPNFFKTSLVNIIKFIPSNNIDLTQEKRRKLFDSIKSSSNIGSVYEAIISNDINIKNFHKYPKNFKSENNLFNKIYAPTDSENIMLADTISYLPNNILVKLDRAAMHVGLETRSPFLDERIANLAWSCRLDQKISRKNNKYITKYILKKLLYKYIPEEFFKRPKNGFTIPLAAWLRGPLKEWANDLIYSENIINQEYLSVENIKRVWASHLNGNSQNTELIWTILMWKAWLKNWKNY